MKCILICLLILCGGFASDILALRCATPDGLSVEDVRKGERKADGLLHSLFFRCFVSFAVVRRCMRKVTHSDSDGQNYEEYENFEGEYEPPNHRNPNKEPSVSRGQFDPSNTYGGRSINPRINQHYDPQTGGNYYDPMPNGRRDANPYQFTSNNNEHVNSRNNFYGSRNHNDGRRNDSNLQHERDRACILQCFFQELKMVRQTGDRGALTIHFGFVFHSFLLALPANGPGQRLKIRLQMFENSSLLFLALLCV
jgi:hypothetical protein